MNALLVNISQDSVRTKVGEILGRMGWKVVEQPNLDEAFTSARSRLYDLFVVEDNPVSSQQTEIKTGRQFSAKVAQLRHERKSETRTILLVPIFDLAALRRGIAAGADDVTDAQKRRLEFTLKNPHPYHLS